MQFCNTDSTDSTSEMMLSRGRGLLSSPLNMVFVSKTTKTVSKLKRFFLLYGSVGIKNYNQTKKMRIF